VSERSAQEIWEAALGELQIQVSRPNYRTWLEKTIGLTYQDSQFVIGVPNTFIAEYLDKNQRSLIERTLIGLTRNNTSVHFQVNGRHTEAPPSLRNREEGPPNFNPKYTFDSLVVGSCNRLACAAARAVAENPSHGYNPLFINSGVGLGKTHLLHAIGHLALEHGVKAVLVTAEQYTNEFITAVRDGKAEEFRKKYRNIDMLLVDDIQFFSGKEQTEESFFHTFNELHNADRQIVITGDGAPKSMPLIQARLRSRFQWGLITHIRPPDSQTRLAILKARAEQQGVKVALDVLEFTCQRAEQSVRELEGSLNRIVAYATLTRAPITVDLAAQALEDIASKAPEASGTHRLVIEEVARSFQLSPTDLKSRKRDKETALARQVAMYLIKQENNCSLIQIGRELGGRGPSTVIHAYEKITESLNTSSYLRQKIRDIQRKLAPKGKSRTP
jgi:chromosomal replication initiator protein